MIGDATALCEAYRGTAWDALRFAIPGTGGTVTAGAADWCEYQIAAAAIRDGKVPPPLPFNPLAAADAASRASVYAAIQQQQRAATLAAAGAATRKDFAARFLAPSSAPSSRTADRASSPSSSLDLGAVVPPWVKVAGAAAVAAGVLYFVTRR